MYSRSEVRINESTLSAGSMTCVETCPLRHVNVRLDAKKRKDHYTTAYVPTSA